MEQKKDLKELILKAVNSLESVNHCFSIISDGKTNNVCIGGYGDKIVNSLANAFLEQPKLLHLIEEAVKLTAKYKQSEVFAKVLGYEPFKEENNSCEEEKCENKEEVIEKMMKEFLKRASDIMKN